MSTTQERTRDESIADALADAIRGVEAGRRVGWAKAFEAIARVEALEEQVRQSRDELKHLRRAYSRLIGLVQNLPIPRTRVISDELATHFAAERSFRHDDAFDAGVAVARNYKREVYGQDSVKSPELLAASRGASRLAMREIGIASSGNGHDIDKGVTSEGKVRYTCACGELDVTDRTDMMDHLARTFGRTWKEIYEAHKAALIRNIDEAH